MLDKQKKLFSKIINQHIKDLSELDILNLIETPPSNIDSDFAFPCFHLSKKLKKSPNNIATELEKNIWQKNIKAIWPYLNFSIPFNELTKFISQINILEYFTKKLITNSTEKILVESPSPNTNKPLHIWHIRNILLANSIVNILKFIWNEVKRVEIVNDRWIHICKSMLAYQKFWNNTEPNNKTDHFVWKRYIKFDQELQNNPKLQEEAQIMLKQREEWKKNIIELRKKLRKRALDWIQKTYKDFLCYIDDRNFESEIYKDWKKLVLEWLKKNIFYKNKTWAIECNLSNIWLDKKILLRKDWTTVYMTQDLELANQRFKKYNMDKMIYVVWNEQKYHFQVLFEIFKKLWFKFANQCFHIAYWTINLTTWKMSSRKWNVILADDLLEEMIKKSDLILKERKNIQTDNKKLAYNIALWAITFFILKYWIDKWITFDTENSLSFEWETWPYIQYTFARINSIFEKNINKLNQTNKIDLNKINENLETKKLITQVLLFEKTIDKVSKNFSIEILSKYLYNLAQIFNHYYNSNKILTEDENQKNFNIKLLSSVKDIFWKSMDLLWIPKVEKM